MVLEPDLWWGTASLVWFWKIFPVSPGQTSFFRRVSFGFPLR
jgi:hypothetical protein